MNPTNIVLDTSAYSHFRFNHPIVVKQIVQAARVYLPVTVLGELEAGFRLGSRETENHNTLLNFLEEPFVATIEVTAHIARRYGEIFSKLRKKGRPIPTNDIWIAACTMEVGGHLVTFDQDFEYVSGLECSILKSL